MLRGMSCRLLSGDQLSVVLEPDTDSSSLGISKQPYKENLFLPFLCSNGTRIIGAARQSCDIGSTGRVNVSGFMYVDGFPIYLNYASENGGQAPGLEQTVHVLGARGYDTMEFRYLKDARLVWDLAESGNSRPLEASIAAGNDHFVVFEDKYGYTRSYPIDLMFIFGETGSFELVTEATLLPSVFFDPISLFDSIDAHFDAPLRGDNKAFGLKLTTDSYSTKYFISSDGMVQRKRGDEVFYSERSPAVKIFTARGLGANEP